MKRVSLLVLACVLALGSADSKAEAGVQAEAAPAAEIMGTADTLFYPKEGSRHHEHRHRHGEHHPQEHGYEDHRKILEHVYSPDYHQPTVVLDYRYLKSGGRDYVRGPGGQIIILPRGVQSHEHKEFPDYDSLIEHLHLRSRDRVFEVQDVSRINQIDSHRPQFNQRDDAPLEYHQGYYHPVHENQWH